MPDFTKTKLILERLKNRYRGYIIDQSSTKEQFTGVVKSTENRNGLLYRLEVEPALFKSVKDKSVKETDAPALAMALEMTKTMKNKIFIRETGNPNEYTVLIYGNKASSGAVRFDGNSNTYGELLVQVNNDDGSYTIKSKNIAAAQGNIQYIKDKDQYRKPTKDEIQKAALDSLIYQIAQGIQLHTLAGEKPITGIILNNYGTAHFIPGAEKNNEFIEAKIKAVKEIQDKWGTYAPHIKQQMEFGEDRVSVNSPLTIGFVNRPLNGFSPLAFSLDTALEIQSLQDRIIQAESFTAQLQPNHAEDKRIIDQCVQALESYKKSKISLNPIPWIIKFCINILDVQQLTSDRALWFQNLFKPINQLTLCLNHIIQESFSWSKKLVDFKQGPMNWLTNLIQPVIQMPLILLGRPLFSIAQAISIGAGFPRATNDELHFAALDMVLSSRINTLEIGGCQSAKDRYGAVRITAQAYKAYVEKYKELPPAFGSKEFEDLSWSKKSFLKEQFARAWLSGIGQEIAARNTEGATGLKNNTQILTQEHQLTIRQEIAVQIKSKLSECSDLTLQQQSTIAAQVDQYIKDGKYPSDAIKKIAPALSYFEAFDPKTSNKLANLNKFAKETAQSFIEKLSSPKNLSCDALALDNPNELTPLILKPKIRLTDLFSGASVVLKNKKRQLLPHKKK
jgi:hypothetical protein